MKQSKSKEVWLTGTSSLLILETYFRKAEEASAYCNLLLQLLIFQLPKQQVCSVHKSILISYFI